MIVAKKYIETGTDGTTQLFQAPDVYLDGTLWVFEVLADGTTQAKTVTDIGGGYFQIAVAPPVGSQLYVSYDIEVVDTAAVDGLTPWEHDNLNNLLATLAEQQKALSALSDSLVNRVTSDQWNAWASIIEKEIQDIKSSLLKT